MFQSGDVLDGLAYPILVINADSADTGKRRADIHKNQGYFAEAQIIQKRLFHSEGQDGNALYSALDHAAHGELHAVGVMRRGGEQDFVVVLNRNIFERLDNFGKKRICDFRDYETESSCLAVYECPRLGVGIVSQFVGHSPDTLRQLRIHRRNMVDSTGDSRGGNPSPLRDLSNIHASSNG